MDCELCGRKRLNSHYRCGLCGKWFCAACFAKANRMCAPCAEANTCSG